MAKTINQRISFTGGKEMRDTLRQIGEAGKQSFTELRRTAGTASDSAQQLQKNFRDLANQADRLGSRLRTVGRNLSLYVTAPITALGVGAVRSFSKFEDSIANISTLIDTTKESIADIKTGILDLGRRVPVPLNDIAEGMYQIRSAGISAADAFPVLESAAKLAVAGRGSVAESVDILTSAINSFQLAGKDATDAASQLFLAVKNGKTTVAELSQGFGAVAGLIKNSNVNFTEFLAAVTALTGPGVKSAQAFTQIRSALNGLTTQTKQATELFQKLGVDSFQQLIKQTGGLVPAFKALRDAANGDNTALARAVGGAEGLNAVLSLTGAQAKNFTATLKDMQAASTAALDEAFQKKLDTLKSTFVVLANNVQEAAIALGNVLAPTIGTVAAVLTSFVAVFTSLPTVVQQVVAGLLALAAAVGPVTLVIGYMVSSFGTLLRLITGFPAILATVSQGVALAGRVFVAFREVLLGTRVALLAVSAAGGPFTILLAAIGVAIGALAVYLAKNGDSFTSWQDVVTGVLQAAADAWQAFEGTIASVMNAVVGIFEGGVSSIKDAWQSLLDLIGNIVDSIKAKAQAAVEFASKIGQALGGSSGGQQGTGFAGGGYVRGPGTSTSDSILAWLSDTEFVQPARAVAYYGRDFMESIRQLKFPRMDGFSMGGLVEAVNSSLAIPRFAAGGLALAGGTSAKTPVTFVLDGKSFGGFSAEDDAVERLSRFAVRRSVQSAGRKPGWVS